MKMIIMLKRFIIWNYWRKNNLNTKLHKLLVLFNLTNSPTFDSIYQLLSGYKIKDLVRWTR